MTETRTPYAAGQQPEPADLDAIEARLAAFAHAQWSGWMKYLFSKGTFNDDGTWTMPKWAVERWRRQMNSDYCDLSVEEKANDLEEASGMIEAADLRALVAEVRRLQALLETEQRAKWAAEQDKQYWQDAAWRLRLQVAQLAEALEVTIE